MPLDEAVDGDRRGRASEQPSGVQVRPDWERAASAAKHHGSFIDGLLLWALRNPGCPICTDGPRAEGNYFFYYLHEAHAERSALEEAAAALGFCSRHGHRLLKTVGAESAIATIHAHATRKVRAALADERASAKLISPEICPACRSFDAHTRLLIHNLADILNDAECCSLYGAPALLCMRHLRMVLPDLSDEIFQRVLNIHSEALSGTIEKTPESGEAAPSNFEDALRATIGHDGASEILPDFSAVGATAGTPHDAIAFLAADLGRNDACPICREIERAWLDWMRNVDAAASRGDHVEDLVPTCAEHVRATMHYGGAALGEATVKRLVSEARRALDMARQRLEPPPIRNSPLWSRWLQRGGGKSRRQRLEAREAIAWGAKCPVCERLIAARDRSLALFFELLRQPKHIAAYQGGHGLCLKHLSRALALGPAGATREIVIGAEAAYLGLLSWELDEFLRKSSWDKRAETRGAEQSAPQRAVRRFSGLIPLRREAQ
jgi:hypothetical protein